MDSIEKLTKLFAQFPTIGSRTAGRFVFYLIRQPKETADELIRAIQELKSAVKLCSQCFNPYEPFDSAQGRSIVRSLPSRQAGDPAMLCPICQDASRSKQQLCIVEKEADLLAIEKTKKYKGLYFILGGTVGLRKTAEQLRLKELQQRIKNNPSISEIILALNPTPEGISTAMLVERTLREDSRFKIQDSGLKISHLARGLPVGGELEYADDETLESAFEGRK